MPRLRSRNPIDSTGLSEKLKNLRLDKDNDNDLPALPIIGVDPYINPSPLLLGTILHDGVTHSLIASVQASPNNGIGNCIGAMALNHMYNPNIAGTAAVSPQRTPSTFRSALVTTAAATTVWDPAANSRFRLLGGIITFEAPTLAAAAATTITFLDQAAQITLAFGAYIPAAASGVAVPISFDLRPNGYLSTTVDNNLRVTLTADLTAGGIRVTVWGTEE